MPLQAPPSPAARNTLGPASRAWLPPPRRSQPFPPLQEQRGGLRGPLCWEPARGSRSASPRVARWVETASSHQQRPGDDVHPRAGGGIVPSRLAGSCAARYPPASSAAAAALRGPQKTSRLSSPALGSHRGPLACSPPGAEPCRANAPGWRGHPPSYTAGDCPPGWHLRGQSGRCAPGLSRGRAARACGTSAQS